MYAIDTVDGVDKVIELQRSNFISRNTDSFTRLDADTIEMNSPYVRKFKNYKKIIMTPIYAEGDTSIAVGMGIYFNSTCSIYVGSLLRNNSNNNKTLNSVACFGIGNTVSNVGEFACGKNNVSLRDSKDDDNFKYNTIFSVGGGNVNNGNLNIIECALRNKIENSVSTRYEDVYIKGIGGYDGTNTASTQSKSLQQVISDIETAV